VVVIRTYRVETAVKEAVCVWVVLVLAVLSTTIVQVESFEETSILYLYTTPLFSHITDVFETVYVPPKSTFHH
jgi:hypothetical protein